MNIIILSPAADIILNDACKQRIRELGNLIIVQNPSSLRDIPLLEDNEPKIVAIDPDFCGWKVAEADLHYMKNVKAICLQTTSFSWIDVEAAKTLNIPVTNLRGFSTQAVAEWALLMVYNVARKVPLVIQDGGKIDFTRHQGIELKGLTAGVIGLGNIGTRIAELCYGLGMEVTYWSRSTKDERFSYKELDALMRESDVIFLTLAQNTETEHLLTDNLLLNMKKSAIFTSVVHKIYNHDLIIERVQRGELYGYAFEGTHKITDFKGNIWAGPELAWCTSNSLQRNGDLWTEAIIHAVRKEYPTQINK
jgi:phosphoglycerate dehydrogenase-like enzyme